MIIINNKNIDKLYWNTSDPYEKKFFFIIMKQNDPKKMFKPILVEKILIHNEDKFIETLKKLRINIDTITNFSLEQNYQDYKQEKKLKGIRWTEFPVKYLDI